MRTRQQDSSIGATIVRPLLWGALAGVLVCVVLLALMAAVLSTGGVPKTAATTLAIAAAVVGAAVGGFLAARLRGKNGWLFGALCGFILFLLTMAVGFSLLQQIRGGTALLKMVLMSVAGAVGGMFGVNRRR